MYGVGIWICRVKWTREEEVRQRKEHGSIGIQDRREIEETELGSVDDERVEG